MKKILLSVSLFTLLLSLTEAKGQSTKTSDVSVTIATVTELTSTDNLAPFAFSTAAQLTAGIEQTNAVTLTYKANKATTLSIKALQSNFASTTATDPMPVGVIQWKKTGGTYAALSTTAATVASGQAKGTGDVVIDYKITPGLAYDPALDYAVTIEYTLTAP